LSTFCTYDIKDNEIYNEMYEVKNYAMEQQNTEETQPDDLENTKDKI